MHIIAGLGNPGKKYKSTRHNAGRIVLDYFLMGNDFPEWKISGKNSALISEGKIGKNNVILVEPETFMNRSGLSLKSIITSSKKIENLIVIYDDLNIPLGKFKISFNKDSGGHKGLDSIIKTIKTREFIRIRVGIAPITPKRKIKKSKDLDFVIKNFKKSEKEIVQKLSKKINKAIIMIIQEGISVAMNKFN